MAMAFWYHDLDVYIDFGVSTFAAVERCAQASLSFRRVVKLRLQRLFRKGVSDLLWGKRHARKRGTMGDP